MWNSEELNEMSWMKEWNLDVGKSEKLLRVKLQKQWEEMGNHFLFVWETWHHDHDHDVRAGRET